MHILFLDLVIGLDDKEILSVGAIAVLGLGVDDGG
jgi:hypothetical protein